jgi:hypothetical protein
MSICILFSAQYRLSSRGSHFCHGVYTFAKKYRVSSRGFHLPEYHGTKPCFPLTPPVIKFSIHICFLRKNTSPFFPKVPEKPGKSTFLDEKSDCLNMARYVQIDVSFREPIQTNMKCSKISPFVCGNISTNSVAKKY